MRANDCYSSSQTFEASQYEASSVEKQSSPKLKSIQSKVAYQWSLKVMEMIRPHSLSPYTHQSFWNKAVRLINGKVYVVERFNHGLAHGMRQGLLAKDIFHHVLNDSKFESAHQDKDILRLHKWAVSKQTDCDFIKKLEMASAFQRSGRQSEASSASNLDLYKKYELQDSVNFKNAAIKTSIFKNSAEIQVFEEAILWSNKGKIDENENEDLKYLRRILHCAHTFDLRRIKSFDGERIQQDGIDQLFGKTVELSPGSRYAGICSHLWNRSGAYLRATGDRDLVDGRSLQNRFFIQSKHPLKMVDALYTMHQ